MSMIYEIFPAEYIALQRELLTGYHPQLEKILEQHGPEDIDMKLAQIASYTGVILDDVYTLDERRKLCDLLRERLIPMRENPNKDVLIVMPASAYVGGESEVKSGEAETFKPVTPITGE